MSRMTDMMEAMPEGAAMPGMEMAMMADCIEACNEATTAATMCADADRGDDMARCSSLCSSTADVATATMRVMMRPLGYESSVVMAMTAACVRIGDACAAECRQHAETSEHCRICADACNAMVMACQELLSLMEPPA